MVIVVYEERLCDGCRIWDRVVAEDKDRNRWLINVGGGVRGTGLGATCWLVQGWNEGSGLPYVG